MTTLAEHMIVVGAEDRPSMLEKSMYESWKSCMLLYIQGKEHGRMIHDSVLNGSLVWGTIEADGITRPKTYEELSEKEKFQADCDLKATNIVLKGKCYKPRGNNVAGQARIVKCYNCHGEGYMARQCTQPKRPRNSAWFKEKMLLVQAQESSQVLDEEQLASLADLGIAEGQVT
nr:hypothetical protein [Tanacetum cinerariifolium]